MTSIFTFRGTFPCTVDQKRRLTVPARFAKALTPRASRTFVAVHGLERCLSLYPLDFWEAYQENLMESHFEVEKARRGVRLMLASALDLEMDPQNRVTLTPEQLERTKIKSSALLIGVSTHLELWSPDVWSDYIHEPGSDSLEETFTMLGEEYRKTARQIREIRRGVTDPTNPALPGSSDDRS